MPTKSKNLRVEFSLTVNLGNFNSAKLGCILDDVIEPGEIFEDKFDELYAQIRTKVREELGNLSHKVKDATQGG